MAAAGLLVSLLTTEGLADPLPPGKGDQESSPQEGQTSSVASMRLTPGLLRSVYLDTLGRPPRAAERGDQLGRQLGEILPGLIHSHEAWNNWLEEQLYFFLLLDNFRPETETVLSLPASLAEGSMGIRDALHRIVLSSSFDLRNPGADTFVTVVMEQLLGVTVQNDKRQLEIGKHLYSGGKGIFLSQSGTSQSDVVRISIEDRRCMRHFLKREYERILREEPGTRELARWSRRLERTPRAYPGLLMEWFLSEAYGRRLESRQTLPNRHFVRSLYVDLTDALPGPDEGRRMRNALDGLADARPLRSVIARLMLDSDRVKLPAKTEIKDPTAWIGGLFERLLGRKATPEELRIFVKTFHEPACRPATVLHALLSHPEYHVW